MILHSNITLKFCKEPHFVSEFVIIDKKDGEGLWEFYKKFTVLKKRKRKRK